MSNGRSNHYKTLQMTLAFLSGTIGMITGVILGKVFNFFHRKCHYYAAVVVELKHPNVTLLDDSKWSNVGYCNFINFEGVLIFISSFIWLWFYVHMEGIIDRVDLSNISITEQIHRNKFFYDQSTTNYSKSYIDAINKERNALFVLPPIVINSLLCLCSLVRAAYISDGYLKFCDKLCVNLVDPDTGLAQNCANYPDACSKLQSKQWIFGGKQAPYSLPFHTMMDFVIALAWLEPVTLALHVGLIMADTYYTSNPPPQAKYDWNAYLNAHLNLGDSSSTTSNFGESMEQSISAWAERTARVIFNRERPRSSELSSSAADPPPLVQGVPDKKVGNLAPLEESIRSIQSAERDAVEVAARIPGSPVAAGHAGSPTSSSSESKQQQSSESFVRFPWQIASSSVSKQEVVKRNVTKAPNIS